MEAFPPSRSSSLATNGRYPRYPGQQTHGSSYPYMLDRVSAEPLSAEPGMKGEYIKDNSSESLEKQKDGSVFRRLRKRSTSVPRPATAPADSVQKSSFRPPHLSKKSVNTTNTTTSSSVYPPSTSSSESPPSPTSLQTPGPPSPSRLNMAPHLAESTDDVAFRLQLLVKNNYYLPPAHAKPNLSTTSLDAHGRSDEIGSSGRKRSLGALFKRSKGRGPQKTPSLPEFPISEPSQAPTREIKRKPVPLPLDLQPPAKPFASPSSLPPSPRIVVLREPLPDIDAAVKASEAREEARRQNLPALLTPKASIGTMHSANYFDLDPTSTVDLDPSLAHQVSNLSANGMGGAIPPEDLSELFNQSGSTGEEETWRRALLQSAVGLSLSDMSSSLNGKRGRGWHSAEQSTSSEWPSSGSRARSASAAGLTRENIPSRIVSSSASSVRSAMGIPKSPLSSELPARPSSAVPTVVSHPPTPRKSSSGRRSIETRMAREERDAEHEVENPHPNRLYVPGQIGERAPSRASVASSRGLSTGGESPTIPIFNGLPIGPKTGSSVPSISGSSRYASAYSSQPLTPSVYLRNGTYGSTPSLHSFVSRHTPSPTPPASARDFGRASPRNPSPNPTLPPPPPRESFSLPIPELTPAPRRRPKQGRRTTPAEEKVLPWTKNLPLAEFSPSLKGDREDAQTNAALKEWGSTPALNNQGMTTMPSAASVSSASVYSEEDTHRRRSQVESSIWLNHEGDASYSIQDDNTPPSLRLAPPDESVQSRYSMDTFGRGKHSGGGSISFLSFDEHSTSTHQNPDDQIPPRLSSTFGDRASTIAGGSSYLDLHQTEDERIDIPTPVSFFDAVEAQHRSRHYDPNMDNESVSEYEPSEAGTEDIEDALREGTIRPGDVGLGKHIVIGPFSAPRSESSKPEEEIDAPGLSETLPLPDEDTAPEPVQEVYVPREDDTPHATPTLPYLSLDRKKPITNVSSPKRTFFKEDRSRRDLSLLPGTSDNIQIKGEVIPQETFERLKYDAINRPSTSASSVISSSTVTKPVSKASTTPSIYSRDSAGRSTTRLVDEDSESSHKPSPTDMRALDGMVAMHMQAEKERIRRITKGAKEGSS